MDISVFESAFAAHKKEMLQACWAGDLSWLQQLYQTLNIQPEAKLDWMEKAHMSHTVFELFMTTIIHEHVPILCYLLTMHPQMELDYEKVARAIVDHPNLEIMKIIHAHHPNIVNLEFNTIETFLTEACCGGQRHKPYTNMTVPLVHYLLDHGADPIEGCFAGCGALYPALESSLPLEIIVKMVQKGGVVNRPVLTMAMKKKRLDALEFFVQKAGFSCHYSIDQILEDARKSEDKEVMSVVTAGVPTLKKRQSRWWQFWI